MRSSPTTARRSAASSTTAASPLDLSIANPRARSLEWTFTFPAAAAPVRRGRRRRGSPRGRDTAGLSLRSTTRPATIRLRRSREMRDAPLPTSLVPGGPIGTKAQQAALRRLAASLLAGDGRYPHLERLLRREPPLGGALAAVPRADDQRALLDRLEGSYLVVQGPPGFGQDLPRRAADHAPDRAGTEGRDHGAEPQGDPQPARRDRARGRRGGARLQGDQARRPASRAHT